MVLSDAPRYAEGRQLLSRIPPAALAGAVILVIACAAAIAIGLSSGGSPAFVAPSESAADSGDGQQNPDSSEGVSNGQDGEESMASGAAEASATFVTVHVAGAVASPGVVTLPEGARVEDAVDAAGGFVEGAAPDVVNLARVLQDGEQVVIPTEEQVEEGTATQGFAGTADSADDAPTIVNINTAGLEELDTLPGVGEATAQAIIDERESAGPFESVEDIQRVSGIGEKKFEKLKDLICV